MGGVHDQQSAKPIPVAFTLTYTRMLTDPLYFEQGQKLSMAASLADDSLPVFSGTDTSTLKATVQEASILLEAAGAEVRLTRNIHNKNLLVDDSTVVLGSFNWLSARRHKSGLYHRFDSSIRFQGRRSRSGSSSSSGRWKRGCCQIGN